MQLAPIYPLIPLYFHANVRPEIKFPGRAARRQEESHIDSDVAIVSVFLESQTETWPPAFTSSPPSTHTSSIKGLSPRIGAEQTISYLN